MRRAATVVLWQAAVEVRSGAERPARTGDDDGSDLVCLIQGMESPRQLGAHLVVERVHAVGPIERERRDAPVDVD